MVNRSSLAKWSAIMLLSFERINAFDFWDTRQRHVAVASELISGQIIALGAFLS